MLGQGDDFVPYFLQLYSRSGGTKLDPREAAEELFHAYEQAKIFAIEFQETFIAERQRTAELQATLTSLKQTLEEKEASTVHLRQANVALQQRTEELARLVAILEATPDFVSISDIWGNVLFLNNAARKMSGLGERESLAGIDMSALYPEWAAQIHQEEAVPAALGTGSWEGELAFTAPGGQVIPVSQVLIAHKDGAGQPAYLSTIARDISERKQFESRLIVLANHDGLTGLYNRRRFLEEIEQERARIRRSSANSGILFIDLDGFKFVNDELGHGVGDELLIALSDTLRANLPETNIIARVGGDEFAALLPGLTTEALVDAAERVLAAIRNLRVVTRGNIARTTASIGICPFASAELLAEELLARADIAMYSAKTLRDHVKLFDATSLADFETSGLRRMEESVRDAIETDTLLLYAQPIRNLVTSEIQWEVLVRIKAADGRILEAASFLAAAERSGLIHQLDREVVRKSIAFLAVERDQGREIVLEVNLSGKAFDDAGLLGFIQDQLSSTGVSPSSLIFEITETAAVSSIAKAQEFIATLRKIGCRFAIDDFGTGLSSYYYLKTLPVDYLKIDGSFIRNLPNDEADQHMVRSMVELARGLGKQTIAEFVGDEETVKLLRSLGVHHGQGYYLGPPLPIQQATALQIVELPAA